MKIVYIASDEPEVIEPKKLSKKQLIEKTALATVENQMALDRLAALEMFSEEIQELKALKEELITLKNKQ